MVEHGPTPRCRSCKARGVGYDKLIHTARCRARYAEFIRGSFDPNAVVERDQGEVQDLGEQGIEGLEGYVELPEDVRDDVGEGP